MKEIGILFRGNPISESRRRLRGSPPETGGPPLLPATYPSKKTPGSNEPRTLEPRVSVGCMAGRQDLGVYKCPCRDHNHKLGTSTRAASNWVPRLSNEISGHSSSERRPQREGREGQRTWCERRLEGRLRFESQTTNPPNPFVEFRFHHGYRYYLTFQVPKTEVFTYISCMLLM